MAKTNISKWYLDCSTLDLCGIFDLTPKAIQLWVAKGCPHRKVGTGFRYSLREVVAWWMENVGSGTDSAATEGVKTEYWRWKTENEKMKAQQTSGALIPREEIASMWAARILEVGTGLYALSSRLPPLVEGLSQAQAASVIKVEVRKLHENYCRTGRFCYAEDKKGKTTGRKPKPEAHQ